MSEVVLTDNLINQLPDPLALTIREYKDEEHPFVKLWLLCRSAEILIRFLVAVAIAEHRRSSPNDWFTDRIRESLLGTGQKGQEITFERPSMGSWLDFLKTLTDTYPTSNCIFPELPEFTQEAIEIISPENASRKSGILQLRNALAHDGRLSRSDSHAYLDRHGHRRRFENFWLHAELLRHFSLYGLLSSEKAICLKGLPGDWRNSQSVNVSDLSIKLGDNKIPAERGLVILLRDGAAGYLDLRPIHCLLSSNDGTFPASAFYDRRQDGIPEYSIFNDGPAYSAEIPAHITTFFNRTIPIDEWRTKIRLIQDRLAEEEAIRTKVENEKRNLNERLKPYKFKDILEKVGDSTCGTPCRRSDEEDRIISWLKESTRPPCGVIIGKPGMGKSTLAVQLFCGPMHKYLKPDWLILPYFFRRGDHRNSLHHFFEALSLNLQKKLDSPIQLQHNLTEDSEIITKRLQQFADSNFGRILIVIDGFNEIPDGAELLLSIIRSINRECISWLIFSQPLPSLLLPDDQSLYLLFGSDGLCGLPRDTVRRLLLENLGHIATQYLRNENDDGSSRFLDLLIKRTAGLPALLRHVIADLSNGLYDFNQPELIPVSLENYYRDVLNRHAAPADEILGYVIAIVAMAKQEVTISMLKQVLSRHPVAVDQDWEHIFNSALTASHHLISRIHMWDGLQGLIPYHETFRDFLLARINEQALNFPLAPILRVIRRWLADFCRKWRQFAIDSPERLYGLRFLVQHLIDDNQSEECHSCFIDLEYIEERIDSDTISNLISELNHIGDRSKFFSILSRIISTKASFLRRHPQSIFQSMANSIGPEDRSDNLVTDILNKWENIIKKRDSGWISRLTPPPGFEESIGTYIRARQWSPVFHAIWDTSGSRCVTMCFTTLTGTLSPELGRMGIWNNQGSLESEPVFYENCPPAVPLAFDHESDRLIVGTESGIEMWKLPLCHRLGIFDLREEKIVATASSSCNIPARLLTANGVIITWSAPDEAPLRFNLNIGEEIISGDFGPAVHDCMAVTASGRVIVSSNGLCAESHLPDSFSEHCNIMYDESGDAIPLLPDDDEDDAVHTKEFFLPKSILKPAFVNLIDLDGDFKKLITQFENLFLNSIVCSFKTRSVSILRGVRIEIGSGEYESFHEDTRIDLDIWRFDVPHEIRTISEPGLSASSVIFSPHGNYLILGTRGGAVFTLTLEDCHLHRTSLSLNGPVSTIACTRGGQNILIASRDLRFTSHEALRLKAWNIHHSNVTSACVSPEASRFATADKRGLIAIWEIDSGQFIHSYEPDYENQEGCLGPVSCLLPVPCKPWIVAGSATEDEDTLWLYDLHELRIRGFFCLESCMHVWPNTIHCSISENGRYIAYGNASNYLAVWAIEDHSRPVFRKRFKDLHGLALSADGTDLAALHSGGLEIYSISTGRVEEFFPLFDQHFILSGARILFLCDSFHQSIGPDTRDPALQQDFSKLWQFTQSLKEVENQFAVNKNSELIERWIAVLCPCSGWLRFIDRKTGELAAGCRISAIDMVSTPHSLILSGHNDTHFFGSDSSKSVKPRLYDLLSVKRHTAPGVIEAFTDNLNGETVITRAGSEIAYIQPALWPISLNNDPPVLLGVSADEVHIYAIK